MTRYRYNFFTADVVHDRGLASCVAAGAAMLSAVVIAGLGSEISGQAGDIMRIVGTGLYLGLGAVSVGVLVERQPIEAAPADPER